MNDKLRKIIKEDISKLFENYDDDDYLSSFEIEDIPEMQPGGEAHRAFISDLENEPSMGRYENITDKEFENIIKGMQQANIDLPSDQELVYKAEKNIHRQLNNNEIHKLLKAKERMKNIMGPGSYN